MVFLFFSCERNKEAVSVSNSPDFLKINVEVFETVNLKTFAKNIEYIPLETREECLISEITKIQNSKDYLYVFSKKQKSIFIFSLEGMYISKIAEFGEGPGKYSGISDFVVDEKSIYLLTDPVGSIFKYDLQGVFIEEIRTKDYYFHELEKVREGWLAHTNDAYDYEHRNNLELYDLGFNTRLYSSLAIEKSRRNNPNRAKNYMASNSKGVYLFENFSEMIYFYSDSVLGNYLDISLDGKTIPDNYPRLFNDNPNEALRNAMAESQFFGFNNILVTDSVLLIQANKGMDLVNCFFALDSREVLAFKSLTSEIQFGLVGDFIGVLNQKYLLQAYSTLLDQLKELYDSEKLTSENLKNEKLFNLVKNYEYEDNPVLVVIDISI